MSGILVSMAWQKALMVKDGKSKSMKILDGESRQVIEGSRKNVESNVDFGREPLETFSHLQQLIFYPGHF